MLPSTAQQAHCSEAAALKLSLVQLSPVRAEAWVAAHRALNSQEQEPGLVGSERKYGMPDGIAIGQMVTAFKTSV